MSKNQTTCYFIDKKCPVCGGPMAASRRNKEWCIGACLEKACGMRETIATVIYVNPAEAVKKNWRIGCKYIANGLCKKCGHEHDLTMEQFQQALEERDE